MKRELTGLFGGGQKSGFGGDRATETNCHDHDHDRVAVQQQQHRRDISALLARLICAMNKSSTGDSDWWKTHTDHDAVKDFYFIDLYMMAIKGSVPVFRRCRTSSGPKWGTFAVLSTVVNALMNRFRICTAPVYPTSTSHGSLCRLIWKWSQTLGHSDM